jgi:hypothetical protein
MEPLGGGTAAVAQPVEHTGYVTPGFVDGVFVYIPVGGMEGLVDEDLHLKLPCFPVRNADRGPLHAGRITVPGDASA